VSADRAIDAAGRDVEALLRTSATAVVLEHARTSDLAAAAAIAAALLNTFRAGFAAGLEHAQKELK
jgi:hypothetical protein